MFDNTDDQKTGPVVDTEAEKVEATEEELVVSPKKLSKEQELDLALRECQDKSLRLLAELDNTRKRAEKSLEETREYAITKFAKELLTVMDIFDKAMAPLNITEITDEQFKNFALGIDLTKQELNKIFNKFGVKSLGEDLIGSEFNPNFHEALLTKPDEEQQNGIIFQVYEPGYMLGTRLLRAAKVGIIKN